MSEHKQLHLKLEVKEITGGPSKELLVLFEISGQSEFIQSKGQVQLILPSDDSKSILSIALKQSEKTIGFTKASLATLFGDSLSGKLDRILKLKSEEHSNLRIKLAGAILKVKKPKSRPNSVLPSSRKSNKSSRSVKEAKCPYLENLMNGAEADLEKINDVWKYRSAEEHSIKITFEPGNTNLLVGDYENANLELARQLDANSLKQLVRGVCEETRQLQVISKDLGNKRKELDDLIQERRDIEAESQNHINFLQESWNKYSEHYLNLVSKKQKKSSYLHQKTQENFSLSSELDMLKSSLLCLQREHHIQSNEKIQFSDSSQSIATLHSLIEKSSSQKESLQTSIQTAKAEFSKSNEVCLKNIENFKSETEEIKSQISKISKENEDAVNSNEDLKKKILELKASLNNYETGKEALNETFEKFNEEFLSRKSILNLIESRVAGLHKANLKVVENFESVLQEKKEKNEVLKGLNEEIEKNVHDAQLMNKEIVKSSVKKISQEQICCLRADLAQLIEDLALVKQKNVGFREELVKDLDVGAGILVSESEKILVQAERLDSMIDHIDKKEEELEGLKSAMGQAQKRSPPYVPVKDDQVDCMLAAYLNAKETPVPIKFIRQDGGNYTFGTKKVYVKIENSRLLVKVGGGFTSIDEFLWIYTPVELEKVDSSPRKSKP